jgi:Lsr2
MDPMATRMSVLISDDLDGTGDAETVTFGLHGTVYEIDLAAKNRAKLEKTLAPFIEAGRRVSGRTRRPVSRRGSTQDNGAIRAWAKSEGLKVSERGRISADVISQYEARH